MSKSFRYNDVELFYNSRDHLIGLAEVFLLDTYLASLLQEGDLVVDLGAGIGDFAILASRRVGPEGKVIALEPNAEDYQLLKINVERNGCPNVTALNVGVAGEPGQKEISFWGKKYAFRVDTLENILARLEVRDRIDFIKMDIEGFEAEVIGGSIETIKDADVISLELHWTKDRVDRMLRPHGFVFRPLPRRRMLAKFVASMFTHPRALFKTSLTTITWCPTMVFSRLSETVHKDRLMTGVYVKSRA